MSIGTQAGLEVAVGGAAILRDLLDKNGDGLADADQVQAVLDEATDNILSALAVAIDVTTIQPPYPDVLVKHANRIGAYYAFLQSTSGMAMPENIREAYHDSIAWLDKVARGDRALGTTVPPGTAHALGQVDVNPTVTSSPPNNTAQPTDGGRITRNSMRGFY